MVIERGSGVRERVQIIGSCLWDMQGENLVFEMGEIWVVFGWDGNGIP